MKHELGTVIARRDYFPTRTQSPAPFVTVEIGAPVKSTHADGEYMCSFRIKSPHSEHSQTIYGIDELQALQLALGHIEAHLRSLSSSENLGLHWVGGEEGDLGIRIPEYSKPG
jgi:hypothetical protein